MRWKWALIVSVALHIGFLAIRPLFGAAPAPQQVPSIELTYVLLQRPALLAKPAELRPARVPALPPAVRAERPAEQPAPVRAAPAPRVDPPASEPQRQVALPSPAVPEVSIPRDSASNIPESTFALVEYKKLIRQHLKGRLTYPPAGLEGTVRVRMVLDGEGMLKQIAVMESSDPRLAEMTVDGIRSAAPYPRSPKQLTNPPPEVEFLVQYRGDDLDSSS